MVLSFLQFIERKRERILNWYKIYFEQVVVEKISVEKFSVGLKTLMKSISAKLVLEVL